MAARDLVAEIAEIKGRGPKAARGLSYEFQALQRQWEKTKTSDAAVDDFYPIRVVTLIEVFTRAWVAQLINHGAPYSERALDVKPDFKLDLSLVRAIHGRAITMGDIIAYSMPLSSFGHVCGIFKTLLDTELITAIKNTVSANFSLAEALAAYPDTENRSPIIKDPEAMRRQLVRLFEVRNILCHEFPRKQVYRRAEIGGFLSAAAQFSEAANQTFDKLLNGNQPTTITGMREDAAAKLERSETKLAEVRSRIKHRDQKNRKLWGKADKAWVVYRNAQADCRADSARGGTVAGLLWSIEANNLTILRTELIREAYRPEEGEED